MTWYAYIINESTGDTFTSVYTFFAYAVFNKADVPPKVENVVQLSCGLYYAIFLTSIFPFLNFQKMK